MLGRRSHEGSSWTSKLPQQLAVRVAADRALDDTTLPLGSDVLPDRDIVSKTSDGCLLVGSRRILFFELGMPCRSADDELAGGNAAEASHCDSEAGDLRGFFVSEKDRKDIWRGTGQAHEHVTRVVSREFCTASLRATARRTLLVLMLKVFGARLPVVAMESTLKSQRLRTQLLQRGRRCPRQQWTTSRQYTVDGYSSFV